VVGSGDGRGLLKLKKTKKQLEKKSDLMYAELIKPRPVFHYSILQEFLASPFSGPGMGVNLGEGRIGRFSRFFQT
jgi:hypothetical protein